jgi:hypothetical protein
MNNLKESKKLNKSDTRGHYFIRLMRLFGPMIHFLATSVATPLYKDDKRSLRGKGENSRETAKKFEQQR